MLAQLEQHAQPISGKALEAASHILIVLPKGLANRELRELPGGKTLRALLERRRLKPETLSDAPVMGSLAHGALASWIALDRPNPYSSSRPSCGAPCCRCLTRSRSD